MAVFRYKMQGILNIREKLESQAKQAFAEAAMALSKEEEILENLKQRKTFYLEEGVRLRNSILDPQKLAENKFALEHMDELIEKQILQVNVANKNLEAARYKMMEARTETRIYEKLKEKEFEEFLAEEGKKESKEIDELNSYRSALSKDRKGM